jgi:hypothetical protein
VVEGAGAPKLVADVDSSVALVVEAAVLELVELVELFEMGVAGASSPDNPAAL